MIVTRAIDAAVRAAVAGSKRLQPKQPKYLTRTVWAAALVLGLGATAQAQQKPADENPPAGGAQSLDVEEITITGSRIKRASDFEATTPTTVVDQSYLNNLGITNMGDALTQLPANISTFSPATTGNSSFFAGAVIPNLRGLNPYFGSRTLALVDGQRFVPTNQGDGLDLNFIPSILVDHMDTVTGGASAAYGSGAVAGVINFQMNRKLEGGKLDADYGESALHDDVDKHLGAAYGFSFLDGKAHMVVGGEFESNGNAPCLNRDWCRQGNGFFAVGPTAYTLNSNLRANQSSETGVIYNQNSPTTYEGNSAGTGVQAWNSGVVPAPPAQSASTIGGDGRSPNQFTNLITPVDRSVIEELFTLAVTDKLNVKLDASYGKVEVAFPTAAGTNPGISVAPDNAYVQMNPQLAAALGPNGGVVNKFWDDQVDSLSSNSTTVKRVVLGIDGAFGDSSWTYDGYYEYGHTFRTQLVQDNLHLTEMSLALDSVIDPATGLPACRSTVTGVVPPGDNPVLAQGCVPINPFGNQPLSAAQKAYAFGNLVENLTYTQNVVDLSTTGNIFDGVGAGPWSSAVGGSYRVEKGDNVDNPGVPLAIGEDYLTQYGASFAGKVAVSEGFLEFNTPFLKNAPFAKTLDLDIAVRESHYDNTGLAGTDGTSATHNMTTWKISGNWAPTEWFRFRGSQSRDARAANFRELYYKQIIGAGGLFGYCGPSNTFTQPCQWTLTGNTALRPEKSDTTTIGFVFEPKEWLSGFQFAADYWRIKISDAILQANPNSVLSGCPAPYTSPLCSQLTHAIPGDPTSAITALTATATNGSGYLYKGIDFTMGYLWDIGGGMHLDNHILATYMMDQLYQPNPGAAFVNVVGQVGQGNSFLADFQSQAKWAVNTTSTFTTGPFDVTGQMRFYSDGVMNYNGYPPGATLPPFPASAFNLSYNRVPSYFLFNLTGAYRLPAVGGFNAQIYGVIDNLFDKQPPVAVGAGTFGATNGFGGTNAAFYDTIGRYYKIGIRATF